MVPIVPMSMVPMVSMSIVAMSPWAKRCNFFRKSLAKSHPKLGLENLKQTMGCHKTISGMSLGRKDVTFTVMIGVKM